MIINGIEKRFVKRCFDFVLTNYKKVPFDKIKKADFALSNSSCHYNAVAAVNGGRADKVWMVWGGKEKGVIHFINSSKGVFFDETWNHYDNQDFYLIREVMPLEFDGIVDLLNASKRMMFNINGTLLSKYFGMKNLHRWI